MVGSALPWETIRIGKMVDNNKSSSNNNNAEAAVVAEAMERDT